MNRLIWMRMLDIAYQSVSKIVLRYTHGDSEWIDCSDKHYRLIVKEKPWNDYADVSDALINKVGNIPNEAEWLGENNEPGRIVFDLDENDTTLNPDGGRYYCRIVEEDGDGKILRPVFMGYFKVAMVGDKYKSKGGRNA